MKIIPNIPFFCRLSWLMFRMRGVHHEVVTCRAEGNVLAEQKAIIRAENMFAEELCEKAGIKINVTGLENVPDGPVVFVSNHQSYWDIPLFFAVMKHKQVAFIAKKELAELPIMGKWIMDIRSIYIEREDVRASLKVFEQGAEYLSQGFSMAIFPEGTRSKRSEIGEFKKGSVRLATKAGVPVVPISFDGTYHAFEEHGVVRPATIEFMVHPPIETKDMSKKEIGELSDRVEGIIRAGFEEILGKRHSKEAKK